MYRSSCLIESRKCFVENCRSTYLSSALYDAVLDADLPTITFLLGSKSVNPNLIIPEFDAAPLHAAPGIGSEELSLVSINLLLDHGADPNIATSDGTTPLMISSLWGRKNVVERLLSAGADPFLEDSEGRNSFDYALESDNTSLYQLMNSFINNIDCSKQKTAQFPCHLKNNVTEGHRSTTNDLFEFTDIDSDVNVIEFYSLNTGFRTPNNFNVVEHENNIDLQMVKYFSDKQSSINSFNLLQTNRKLKEEKENDENSIGSMKTSSSQVSVLSYATDHLKQELKRNKIVHGPVTKTTKKVYQTFLAKVIKGKKTNPTDEYSCYPELLRSTFKEKYPDIINKWHNLEELMSNNFSDNKKIWRGGKEKQFFTYLLLDPFITNNLPQRKNEMNETDIWKTFISSVFYVGKGKNSRPFSHLYEALKTMKKKSYSAKVKRIQSIWDNSAGIICLHVFHNLLSAEAHTREAAMIEAIGPSNLTNIQSGEYYGIVKNWNIKQKRQLGVVLLHKALQIYLAEGERQIYAADLF